MSANEPERFLEAQATAEATTETEVVLSLNEPTVTAEAAPTAVSHQQQLVAAQLI